MVYDMGTYTHNRTHRANTTHAHAKYGRSCCGPLILSIKLHNILGMRGGGVVAQKLLFFVLWLNCRCYLSLFCHFCFEFFLICKYCLLTFRFLRIVAGEIE